jgi:hypothetical protein
LKRKASNYTDKIDQLSHQYFFFSRENKKIIRDRFPEKMFISMESQAQRRLHAIQCHLLPSSTASDDPFSHVQPNVTAAEFFHGSLSLSLYYVCMYEKQLSLRVVILRVRLVRSLKLTDSCEVCFPKIKKY